jgi:cell division protein ZipA
MDWQLRIALIVIGALVIGFIVFDYNRRKKAQAEKQRLIEQMHSAAKQSDGSGFDNTGVGNVRRVKVEPQMTADDPQTSSPVKADKAPASVVKREATSRQAKPSPNKQMKFAALKDSQAEDMPAQAPEMVISLILKAAEGKSYKGSDFMPLLLSQGLRHGEMGIFHRHAGGSGKPGPIMYSVANAIKPGTFDLKNIQSFETPAFAFFISLPGPVEAVAAFEGMVKTIRMLKDELGGQILDESKSVYTEQTYQHQLDQLREYLTKASVKLRR